MILNTLLSHFHVVGNERVDINAGGSYFFENSKSCRGWTLDSGVEKAGFIFKLG